jgi:cytochrome b
MQSLNSRWVEVWDLPTRLFHWALAFFVLGAYFTSAGRPYGFQFLLHVICGYAIILLILFRLAWGIAGGEYARFGTFVRGWDAVKDHARSLFRLSPSRASGHNPIGGWMIMAMLATLALTVVTGLMAQGKTGGTGPITALIPIAAIAPIGAIHQFLGTAILYLAGLHVLGVVAESILLRENLSRAMLSGRKSANVPEDRDAGAAPVWRSVAIAAILAGLGLAMARVTTIPERPASTSHMASPGEAGAG